MNKALKSFTLVNPFKGIGKEFFQLVLMLTFSTLAIYFVPAPFNKFLFLGLIPLALRTKKAYFWFAYLLIVLDQPGGLFYGGSADDPLRFPLFTLYSGFSFGLDEILLIILFIKAYQRRRFNPNIIGFFKSWMQLFALLFVLLVLVSPILGMGIESIKYLKKAIIYLSTFYTLLYGFSRSEVERLLALLIPFTFFALFFQLFSLANQYQFIHLVRSDIQSVQGEFNKTALVVVDRPIEMTTIVLLNFVSTLYFLQQSLIPFSRRFLITINLLSFVAILMTATRSWFIAFVIAYLLYFLFLTKIFSFRSIYTSIGIFLASLVLLVAVPTVRDQVNSAFTRLSTITAFAKGDITAKGTLKRYDIRAPKVVSGIKKSTILLGAGFSKLYMEYDDFHVGYHNMFLNMGLIGCILVLAFALKLATILFQLRRFKSIWGVPLLGVIILLIINSGSQTLGFNVTLPSRYLLQSLVFALLAKTVSYCFDLSRLKIYA